MLDIAELAWTNTRSSLLHRQCIVHILHVTVKWGRQDDFYYFSHRTKEVSALDYETSVMYE